MTIEPSSISSSSAGGGGDKEALRQDIGTEYYSILGIVSDYDQRLVIVKGWSVTLSLAGLGLGFQQGHYALFGLAALTAAAFWLIDVLYKGYQLRYYSRMRDIEVTAYHLNHVSIPNVGDMSAPCVDAAWESKGAPPEEPKRRSQNEVEGLLRKRWYMPQVLFPHLLAVALGLALFLAALAGMPGLDRLRP